VVGSLLILTPLHRHRVNKICAQHQHDHFTSLETFWVDKEIMDTLTVHSL
jgi:predicted class III extradiol MEMO1 family dioxygenase